MSREVAKPNIALVFVIVVVFVVVVVVDWLISLLFAVAVVVVVVGICWSVLPFRRMPLYSHESTTVVRPRYFAYFTHTVGNGVHTGDVLRRKYMEALLVARSVEY
jgi:hypothetical protein